MIKLPKFPRDAFDLVAETFGSANKQPYPMSYCSPEYKDAAHKSAVKLLKHFATHSLKLEKGTFEVRSNKGGIAVSGEVTLHTDPLPGCDKGIYVEISDSCVNSVMYRTVTSRKDYTSGKNCFTDVRRLSTPARMDVFAADIKQMCAGIMFQVR